YSASAHRFPRPMAPARNRHVHQEAPRAAQCTLTVSSTAPYNRPLMTVSREKQAPVLGDWDAFLHEQVRSPELRRLPPGAKTVLSGGAAGSWYFDWFNACYPTRVERHFAVEAFAREPEDLPSEVEWLPRTLGDLEPVADGEVDL